MKSPSPTAGSLFRYFDDIEDLCRAAVDRQHQRALPLVPVKIDQSAPLAARITALVSQRVRLFEFMAPAAADR
jgi:AcrR family transcriptional regulator